MSLFNYNLGHHPAVIFGIITEMIQVGIIDKIGSGSHAGSIQDNIDGFPAADGNRGSIVRQVHAARTPQDTGVPGDYLWTQNVLYFTGTTTFNDVTWPDTSILAPHFNVNIGNIAEVEPGASTSLTGAVVGGIVDVRGNAEIYGTIISMFDTTPYSSGYVTNIGATLDRVVSLLWEQVKRGYCYACAYDHDGHCSDCDRRGRGGRKGLSTAFFSLLFP